MIIEDIDQNMNNRLDEGFECKIYNPNKNFKSKNYFKNFEYQIALKNWNSLIKIQQKIDFLLKDDSKVIISEKIGELYEALDFDPNLYKDDKKKISAHPKYRETCKEIVSICDS